MRKTGKIVKCENCGIETYRPLAKLRRNKNHFCSPKCFDKFRENKVIVQCQTCGKKVERVLSRVKRHKKFIFCDRKCQAKGLKGVNLSGFFKKGDTGKKCINYKNGTQEENGYIAVLVPDHPRVQRRGYVYEHRLVMEAHIGRYLRPEEVVHHINFDTTDNKIENLMLFDNDQEHQKYHRQLKKGLIKI